MGTGRIALLASVLALLSLRGNAGLLPISLRETKDGERILVDSAGRERFFHGENVIVKGPPWIPDTDHFSMDISLVEDDFRTMKEMGVNIIRLGAMWPGIEPTRGQYDEEYLNKLKTIADNAAAYGVYVLLDGHQDAFSERFCGEGFPDWVRQNDGEHPFGLIGNFPAPWQKAIPDEELYTEPKAEGAKFPTRQECHQLRGPQFQAAKQPAAAYEALYMNKNGTGDAWAAMWRKVAELFKGDANILGLELINEPFAGDLYHNPLIMVPHPNPDNADKTRLQPAYDRINTEVRKADQDRLIFFAGVTWDDAGPGFSHPPGGEDYANRSVLAFHYYQGPQVSTQLQLKMQRDGARRLKTGFFLTESAGGDKGGEDLWDVMDDYRSSWAHWSVMGGYKTFCREAPDAEKSESQMSDFGACRYFSGTDADCCKNITDSQGVYSPPVVQRTYPEAVAGHTTYIRFNTTTHHFQLDYEIDTNIDLPTEIRVTPQTYPSGFQVSVSPVLAARAEYDSKAAPHVVKIVALAEAIDGTNVTVTIAHTDSFVV